MKTIVWDNEKNLKLKAERGVSFEDVLFHIMRGDILDLLGHPGKKHKHQQLMVVRINDYAYLVPFVETENEILLKTIIPSRKATKNYLSEDE
ncbi:MAG: hypothetical protein ACD_62C00150G0001 [uncultured bacterium]|nr:MAG: hypothetical protein ACD_62C00150G0001 [uncultured bacterium]HLD43866.1 BrnT family toxin [bacterium]